MSHITIPKFLYDNRIVNLLTESMEFGAERFDQLNSDVRSNLAVVIIDILGTDAYETLIGSDNVDKTLKYFSNYLKSGRQDDAYDLLTQLRENSLDHYEPYLESLFDEILEWRMSA